MINNRLRPALDAGEITLMELADFLASAEEHGKQHVLLYSLRKNDTDRLFKPGYISSVCASEARFPDFNSRSIISIPNNPTIAEIRSDSVAGEEAIIVKVIEKRHVRDENSYKEWEEAGKLYTSVDTRPYRAANVVRIRRSGLCEVRIHSHMNAYEYDIEARALLNSLDPLVHSAKLSPNSLHDARQFVCEPTHRKKAMGMYDVKHTEHLDMSNGRLRPSISGAGASMLSNPGLVGAMDAYQKANATVHRAGLTVRAGMTLRRGLNLGLSGADNEFFLTAKVTRDEYEFVLETLLDAVETMATK